MYTREKLIKIAKVINVLFIAQGIELIATSMAFMANLIAVYHDQLETVLKARGTPGCIHDIVVGTLMLIIACFSRRCIGDANFYSSYFELDLDGYVLFKELASITEKKENYVKKRLRWLKKIYMKGYKIQQEGTEELIVLDSKMAICECKNCAARIEKRMYFTGECPYCGSSDLFAKVLTGNRFYSIESQLQKGKNKIEFYSSKYNKLKKAMMIIYWLIALLWIGFCILVCISCILNYNDEEYLDEILFTVEGPHSYAAIRQDIIETFIWGIFMMVAVVPVAINRFKNIKYLSATQQCAEYFSRCKRAIIPISWLPSIKGRAKKKIGLAPVRASMRRRYLKNCTFEVHDEEIKVALAKKVVKDKCPSCYGAITGAVDENYRCRYCNNLIMDVVVKK